MLEPNLLFGASLGVRRAIETCDRYAVTPYPILILGPPGVGKTSLATLIHRRSQRQGALVRVSVPELAPELVQSALAGHVKGAFTSAVTAQQGLLEVAHEGTLFVDEVATASAAVQELLLSVVERRTLRRVGDVRDLRVDVRLVLATNADLDQLVELGRFRRDLLDRIGYGIVRLPPLSERRDEILPLVEYWLGMESALLGVQTIPALSSSVRDCLLAAPWPDNIRGIQNLCRDIVTRWRGNRSVEVDDLPERFLATCGDVARFRGRRAPRDRVEEAMHMVQGNRSAAARMLGLSRRQVQRILNG